MSGFFTNKKPVRTTILIDSDDYDFIRMKRFKATSLLRVKIQELKDKENGETPNYEEINKKLIQKIERICSKLTDLGLSEEQFKQITQA